MKKTISSLLVLGAMLSGAPAASAQTLTKGDILADFGVGVGVIKGPDSKATFTQRLGGEYIFRDDLSLFGRDFKLGLGLAVTNSFCRPGDMLVAGMYNYDYNIIRSGMTIVDGERHLYTNVSTQNRAGTGLAVARQTRSDLTFLPQATIHYEPVEGIDVYATLGVGLGLMNYSSGEKTPVESQGFTGFGGADYSERTDLPGGGFETVTVRYDDMANTTWFNDRKTDAAFAMAIYAGVRYWFTPRFAANLQVGMVSGAIKKSWGSNYDLCTIGASWKF